MRLATKADKEAILNIWTVCFGADQRYQNILTANDYSLKDTYVLEVNKEIASILTVLPVDFCGQGETRRGSYLYGVATLPKFRGNGYSSKLMKEVLDKLSQEGSDFALLYPAEEGLQSFYAAQGFVPCGTQWDMEVSEEQQEAWLEKVDDYTDSGYELEPVGSGKEYGQLRHGLLEASCAANKGEGYFLWSPEHYAFNHNEAGYYGGGLCKISKDGEAVAIAGCWPSGNNSPWERGKIIVKEFFAQEEHKEAALAILAEFAGSKALWLSQPAWEAADGGEKVPFGMIRWLKECKKLDLSDSYLALVLD